LTEERFFLFFGIITNQNGNDGVYNEKL
jgi:hypothetical protein